jgi:tetratricopeptide (TPR) repeat protein
LHRRIGQGSYGEVWLARNIVGTWRAVKIVERRSFERAEHFEREFKGLQKFEPISRSHEGLVDILHIGRDDAAGCFYYVMELADDANDEWRMTNGEWPAQPAGASPQSLHSSFVIRHSELYAPRTLRSALQQRGPLPLTECIDIGLALASALQHLHESGLVHRDIKPSNIIFVQGAPKLADIGLVTNIDEAHSLVGTAGYIPPEGPGTPQADIYALGKVLYEISLGKDRQEFPQLPPDLQSHPDHAALLELNEVTLKACESDPRRRYASAQQLQDDLARLQRGQSVKRRRAVRRRWVLTRNFSLAAMLMAVAGVGPYSLITWLNLRPAGTPFLQTAERTTLEGTTNLQAYKKYVQGRAAFNQLTPEGKQQAIQYLTEAIQLDPKFLRAYEKLFDAYINSFSKEADAKAREIADTLEALDASSEEAHLARGWIKYEDWEFAEAEKQFKLAISADPKRPLPHGMYGCFLVEQGRVPEARAQLQLCDDLDPGFPIVKVLLGRCFYFERNYAEAIAAYRYALSVAQNYSEAYKHIAKAQEARHEIEAAIDARQQARIIDDQEREQVKQQSDALRQAFREAGERGYWLKRLEQARVEPRPDEAPYEMATLYVRLGEKEQALDWLDKAYVQHDWQMRLLLLDQCWDGLRDEARFQTLLKNVGFVKAALPPAAGTKNLDAYKLYEKARVCFRRFTIEGEKLARQYATEAVKLDPNFLAAYQVLFTGYVNSWVLPAEESDAGERATTKKLMELDPNSAEAQYANAWVRFHLDLEFAEAEQGFRRAIQIDPDNAFAQGFYGCYLSQMGRLEEARQHLRRFADLDPGFPPTEQLLGSADYVERKYDQALARYQKALELAPNYFMGRRRAAEACEAKGDYLSAIEHHRQIALLRGESAENVNPRYEAQRRAFKESGARGYWLNRLESAQKASTPENRPYSIATILAQLGNKEEALDWLEKAYAKRDSMDYLLFDHYWDGLRDEPRFQALLKKVGYVK